MDAVTTDTIKTCPQCGNTFTCTPHDCWCSALPPVMPMVEDAECYCPSCLKAIIEERTSGVPHL